MKPDYTEKVRAAKLAADRGDAGGQNDLGWLYEKGKGVKEDYAEAARLFKLAADQGYGDAQKNLAALLQKRNGANHGTGTG